MKLKLSRFIEADLDAIAAYIARDNPTRAVSFLQEIGAKMRAVGENPRLYWLRPEIGTDARIALVGRYGILFRILGNNVRSDVVSIERVVYCGRDLVRLLEKV